MEWPADALCVGHDQGESDPYAPQRARIARLDRDASLLRNRSQITAQTRARINSLMDESARLRAALPETAARTRFAAQDTETERARFAHGHRLYLAHQAPALTDAVTALHALIPCTLPPPLERQIVDLVSTLERHATEMSVYTPSQGLPAAMDRLTRVYSR